jgi:hypothetical protein
MINDIWKIIVGLGYLVVIVLVTGFAVSDPAEDDGFLRAIKIRSKTSFGKEGKASVSCLKILRHVKGPYEYERDTL